VGVRLVLMLVAERVSHPGPDSQSLCSRHHDTEDRVRQRHL